MNKQKLIKELSIQTGYEEETCILINHVIENHFIVGRKNKEKMIQDLKDTVHLKEDDAENVYDIMMKIIMNEIKNKVKHPFKSQD